MISITMVPPLRETDHDFARWMGHASILMSLSPQYCQYPVICLREWLRPAVLLGQFGWIHDRHQRSLGYLTWAYLTAAVERRLVDDPEVLLHLSEWNEGRQFWIMDLLLIEPVLLPVKALLPRLFPEESTIKYLRRNHDGAVRKVVTWECRSTRHGRTGMFAHQTSTAV